MTIWLMTADALERRLEAQRQVAARGAMGETSRSSGVRVSRAGGVATVELRGALIPERSLLDEILDGLGYPSTSTRDAARVIDALSADPSVRAIELLISSPGGTVDGTAALADAVARSRKPVTTIAPDLMASAALWVGAQAGSIYVGPTAAIGSIGVYSVVVDSSRAAEAMGVKVHVISSGGVKGAGVPGSKVTEEQIAAWQSQVDAITKLFVEAVARGRRKTVAFARMLATGQVWIGAEAVEAGLANGLISRRTSQPPQRSKGTARAEALVAKLEADLAAVPRYLGSSYRAQYAQAERRGLERRLAEARARLPKTEPPPPPTITAPIGASKGQMTMTIPKISSEKWSDLSPHARHEIELAAQDEARRLVADLMNDGVPLVTAIERVRAEHPELARFI